MVFQAATDWCGSILTSTFKAGGGILDTGQTLMRTLMAHSFVFKKSFQTTNFK